MGEPVTGPSRRPRADGGRPHSVRVSFSEMEMAMVRSAAARAGVADASWLGEVGVRAAESSPAPVAAWGPVMQQLMVFQARLADVRRILRNVGGNLNDVAKHANSTGEVLEETHAVEALVARVVQRVDQEVAHIGELTARARREQLRSRP